MLLLLLVHNEFAFTFYANIELCYMCTLRIFVCHVINENKQKK